MRLLLVEDEQRMAQALCEILRLEKYDVDYCANNYLTKPFMTRELLAVKIWDFENEAENNNIEVYMSFTRKKLAFAGSKQRSRP